MRKPSARERRFSCWWVHGSTQFMGPGISSWMHGLWLKALSPLLQKIQSKFWMFLTKHAFAHNAHRWMKRRKKWVCTTLKYLNWYIKHENIFFKTMKEVQNQVSVELVSLLNPSKLSVTIGLKITIHLCSSRYFQ